MSTVYAVNSSLIFLTLIIDELNSLAPLSMIQEVRSIGSLKTVWDGTTNIDPTKADHHWTSYKLTFDSPVDLSPIFQQYPSSIKQVEGLEEMPGENIVSSHGSKRGHIVNSSLIFLKLIIDELPGISSIENLSQKRVVWDNSMNSGVKSEDVAWSSFKLTFESPFSLTPLLKKYPTSIIEVGGVPREKEVEEVEEEPVPIRKQVNKQEGEEIRKISLARAPNGFNSSDPYSGIGEPYQNNSGFKVNFIDPGPPAKYKQARGTSANSAVKQAHNEINAKRSSIVANSGKKHMN